MEAKVSPDVEGNKACTLLRFHHTLFCRSHVSCACTMDASNRPVAQEREPPVTRSDRKQLCVVAKV